MSKIQTAEQLAAACKKLATDYKTLYVLGCIGAPMTAANKVQYLTKHCADYNGRADRKKKIQAATAGTFGFDCVCMIKALLWDWSGSAEKTYGGTNYASNGVPDIDADFMIQACKDASADFSRIEIGEVVWNKGHIGVYVGGGLAVECTPNWKDGVQITAVHNIATKAGYNGRKWTKHGKLPWVTYENVSNLGTIKPDYTLGMRILREGCTGDDVRALQILLKANGCSLGTAGPNKDGIDGEFGQKTGDAVEAYQGKENLTQDRVAGINTMSHLMGVK